MSANPLESIILDHPYTTAAGALVERITLRRCTVRDQREVQKHWPEPADQEVALVARLTGMVPEDLDGMDSADYAEVQRRFQGLFSRRPVGGGLPGGAGAAGEVVAVAAERD
jgi:hypothetical protein